MTGDLVPALSEMTAEAREVAVTHMLTEAQLWLANAVEATEPHTIATFKAQMATVAEATKQLNLSKAIQLDSQEMLRRAERGVGKAIRAGQADGTVETPLEASKRAILVREVNQGRQDRTVLNGSIKTRPLDLASDQELRGNDAGILHLTDGVSDEQFEAALVEAKAEANLSRANVVRKAQGKASKLTGGKRLDRIEALAQQGWTGDQIAHDIGHTQEYTRQLARDAHIPIPGDVAVGKRRRIDHQHIAEQTVIGLEGLALGLQLLDLNQVDPREVRHWVTSMNDSLRTLNRFQRQLKEMTQ